MLTKSIFIYRPAKFKAFIETRVLHWAKLLEVPPDAIRTLSFLAHTTHPRLVIFRLPAGPRNQILEKNECKIPTTIAAPHKNNFEESFKSIFEAAKLGNPHAQNRLGEIFLTKKDIRSAKKWFLRALENFEDNGALKNYIKLFKISKNKADDIDIRLTIEKERIASLIELDEIINLRYQLLKINEKLSHLVQMAVCQA